MYALSGLYKIRILWTETTLAAQLPSNKDKHRIPLSSFVSLGIRTMGYNPYFTDFEKHLNLFFFILLPFKNKNYFTLDNLSKYGNITLKFAVRYFYLLVTILSKKKGYFSPKLWGEKKLSKSAFGYFKTKKKKFISPKKRPLVEEFFLRLPLRMPDCFTRKIWNA